MNIAIITDGNEQLGLGHVYQSLTLAKALKERNFLVNINFMTKSDEKICDFLASDGYKVTQYDNDDAIFAQLKIDNPERVIFDKLDVCPVLAEKIKKELKIKLVIFTNLTEASNYADVTVFPGFGNDFTHGVHRNKDTKKIDFYGLKYWLLRSEFYLFKKKKKRSNKDVLNRIMLMFGASDPANMTSHVLNVLLQLPMQCEIRIVLGSSFSHLEKLNQIIQRYPLTTNKISIMQNIKNVAEIMSSSDLVMTSPGLSLSEALVVETPVIGFHQNEQQKTEYAGILPTLGLDDLHRLPLLIKNRDFIYPDSPLILAMEIGEGKEEVITEILAN